MKTASVRDLRNHYGKLLFWVKSGEEVVIQERGRAVARLIPTTPEGPEQIDWSESAALGQDKSGWKKLSAKESANLLDEIRA